MSLWRGLSLRARLNLLSALLLVAALVVNVGSLVAGAGPRIEAEIASSMRLAGDVVEAALTNLRSGGDRDADAAIDRLVGSLQNFRHVRISREREGQVSTIPAPEEARSKDVPAWFAALVHPKAVSTRINADVGGRKYGHIVIASYPYDEMVEVWDGARSLTLVGLVLVLTMFGLTIWIVDRSLVPVRDVDRGLARLAAGDYALNFAPAGPPEFIEIGVKLNELSATLAAADSENRYLVQKLISVQDDERKQLARELHDEYGAHLFAIRANMTSLVMGAGVVTRETERLVTTGRAILELVDNLQRLNRRILGRLRPSALGELGLAEAVRGLAAIWEVGNPDVKVDLELAATPEHLDEPVALAAYRMIQESLTNVFRHSGAKHVRVHAEVIDHLAGAALRLQVEDDGRGMSKEEKPGLGLLGMRERVRGLGGSFTSANQANRGFRIEAVIPLGCRRAAAAE